MNTEKTNNQVLSKEDVKSVLVEGDIKKVAEQFGVSRSTVHAAINLWITSPLAFEILKKLADNARERGQELERNAIALEIKLNHYKASA
jgi:uncharacterized protein YidB (DUF937 family)